MHYLALTFSTLLSSQVSGAHRAGAFAPVWGNSTHFMRGTGPSQTDPDNPLSSAPQPPDQMSTSWRTSIRSTREAVGFPPGRPLRFKSVSSRTPGAEQHYAVMPDASTQGIGGWLLEDRLPVGARDDKCPDSLSSASQDHVSPS